MQSGSIRALVTIGLVVGVFGGACGSNPEVITGDDGVGGSSSGGSSAGGNSGTGSGGIVDIDGGDASGGTGGTGTACGGQTCGPGQRCDMSKDPPECVDNTCSDLDCSMLEECTDAPGGGKTCTSISCTSDVECPPSRYCDGEKCVDDVCEAGVARCEGNQVYQCASNGGSDDPRFTCNSPAYYTSTCGTSDSGQVGCSCEDDWDCPAFTECEAGTCSGTGMAPTCTLDPVSFSSVLPAQEIAWGGQNESSPDATGHPYPNSSQVASTPLVVNLTDDNGDGLVNELDFPEIVFVTYSTQVGHSGMIRAIHGGGPNKGEDYFAWCNGSKRWFEGDDTNTGSCSNSDAVIRAGGAMLAVGDLDYDGVPEIVAPTESGSVVVLNNRGEEIAESATQLWPYYNDGSDSEDWDYPAVALANLDYAGLVEIIVADRVLTLTNSGGTLEFQDVFSGDGALSIGAQDKDTLDDQHFGPVVCVADVRDDIVGQEIVSGTTLYQLPEPPNGETKIADCAGGDMSDFCQGKLTKVWDAQEVNGTSEGSGGIGDRRAQGFCAVADVLGATAADPPGPSNPLDGKAEVILIADGYLVILDGEDGTRLRFDNLDPSDSSNYRGGCAPNIDDFDGDGFPEIATALKGFYRVIDLQEPEATNCPAWPNERPKSGNGLGGNTERNPGPSSCTDEGDCNAGAVCSASTNQCVCLHNGWIRDSEDDSSRATSSSVFDFNGDGAAEVVYNDECFLRIYDGVSGDILFDPASLSRTILENPVVADVDNDGNAEIVIINNNETIQCGEADPLTDYQGNMVDKSDMPNGLFVWGDPTDQWVSARRVWNQHSYHVTNVTEAGGIPLHEPEGWLPWGNRLYNSYRSQPRSFGVAPDLALVGIQVSSPDVACGALSDELQIVVEVKNQGDLRVGPGVVLEFFGHWSGPTLDEALQRGNGSPLTATLQTSLEPGASVLVTVNWDKSNNSRDELPNEVRVVIDGANAERECNEDNNDISSPVEPGDQTADLRLQIGDVTGPCSGKQVEVTVFNDGSMAASDVLVRLYAGDPSAGGKQVGETTIAGPIGPGESETVTVTIDSLSRSITLFGIADPLDTIEECNDANNRDQGPKVNCGLVF